MKRTMALPVIILMAFSVVSTVQAAPAEGDDPAYNLSHNYSPETQLEMFSKNLVNTLKSDHDGLKAAAMGMVIRYGDQVDVKDAVIDVMHIYRTHESESMRRLAVVTLGSMNSNMAIRYLERAEQFEDSPVLRQTMRAVVAVHHAQKALQGV